MKPAAAGWGWEDRIRIRVTVIVWGFGFGSRVGVARVRVMVSVIVMVRDRKNYCNKNGTNTSRQHGERTHHIPFTLTEDFSTISILAGVAQGTDTRMIK